MTDTATLKQKLEEEKALLQKELSGVGSPNPENPADWDAKEEPHMEKADLNMSADIQEDMRERHAISDELEGRLKDVNLALQKMEQGTYGICEVDGEKIEDDRLEADPAARTCKKHINDLS